MFLNYKFVLTKKFFFYYRYKLPSNVFEKNSNNSCFCEKQKDWRGKVTEYCSPSGIFNTSKCNFGAPLLSSFPHFYLADKSLMNHVDGLKPEKDLHETYVDLHSVSNKFYILEINRIGVGLDLLDIHFFVISMGFFNEY